MKDLLIPIKRLIFRSYNEIFNYHYIRRRNLDSESIDLANFENDSAYKYSSTMFMSAWLKNIDMLIRPLDGRPSDFHFLDVGCGKGIPSIYVRDTFDFMSVSGFDFEPALLQAAHRNYVVSGIGKPIHFFLADATEIFLEERRWFVFMFNPFGPDVMRIFLANNHQSFKRNGSAVAYANACHLDVVADFCPSRLEFFAHANSALVQF